MGRACLAFETVGDDGLDHRKLPRENEAEIENVDSRKLLETDHHREGDRKCS
jgi:hypothetical protein